MVEKLSYMVHTFNTAKNKISSKKMMIKIAKKYKRDPLPSLHTVLMSKINQRPMYVRKLGVIFLFTTKEGCSGSAHKSLAILS